VIALSRWHLIEQFGRIMHELGGHPPARDLQNALFVDLHNVFVPILTIE
jgi:hypothetical protein